MWLTNLHWTFKQIVIWRRRCVKLSQSARFSLSPIWFTVIERDQHRDLLVIPKIRKWNANLKFFQKYFYFCLDIQINFLRYKEKCIKNLLISSTVWFREEISSLYPLIKQSSLPSAPWMKNTIRCWRQRADSSLSPTKCFVHSLNSDFSFRLLLVPLLLHEKHRLLLLVVVTFDEAKINGFWGLTRS